MSKSYVQTELESLGFKLTRENDKEVVMEFGGLQFLFKCECPADALATALDCPIHCSGTGGSYPIEKAKKIAEFLTKENPERNRLPDTRRAITHSFDIAGHEG